MNKIKSIPVECLLNNFIDEDFQAAYMPLNFADKLFLSPKFIITNNFITPTNKVSYIRSAIGVVVQVSMQIYRAFLFTYIFMNSTLNTPLYLVWLNELLCVISLVFIYTICMVQSENSVLLMIKIKEALRIIDSDRSDILTRHKLWNWISTITIPFVYLIYNLPINIDSIFTCVVSLPAMIFDLNFVYATRTVALIGSVLTGWNRKMMAHGQARVTRANDEIQIQGNAINDLLQAYKELIDAFRLCKKIFQFVVLFQVYQTFIQILSTIQIIIGLNDSSFNDANNVMAMYLMISAATVWNIKNIVLQVNLGTACEKFYEQVKVAEVITTQLQNSNCGSDVRKACKNVLRYNRAVFRKLSAFGVLEVDAALPLRLLAVVLTYTVVLLQFAFL